MGQSQFQCVLKLHRSAQIEQVKRLQDFAPWPCLSQVETLFIQHLSGANMFPHKQERKRLIVPSSVLSLCLLVSPQKACVIWKMTQWGIISEESGWMLHSHFHLPRQVCKAWMQTVEASPAPQRTDSSMHWSVLGHCRCDGEMHAILFLAVDVCKSFYHLNLIPQFGSNQGFPNSWIYYVSWGKH